jgi:hypothetical protein
MKRWLTVVAVGATLMLPAAVARAQDPQSREGDPNRDPYADYEEENRFALGVGIGLIEPSNSGITEPYIAVSLRIRAGHKNEEDYGSVDRGIRGYIEPEVSYWETEEARGGEKASDLAIGANLIGVVPFGNVETFFGAGAALHQIDAALLKDNPDETGTASKVGVNAQFGVDLFLGEHLSAFGAGRFDLVQDAEDSLQTKVYLGLRAHF